MSNPAQSEISEADARAMVRLLGDTSAVRGGHSEQKRFLLNGLCEIIAADSWVWGLACLMVADHPPVYVGLLFGGFTDSTYSAFTRAYEHPDMAPFQQRFAAELAEKRTHLTRTRQQLDPEEEYLKSGVASLWQMADINGVIMSLRPMDANSFSTVCLYRRFAAPPFSLRENRIAHIVLSEVPWLHAQGWPEDRGVSVPRLTPRQRMTMNLMLNGQTRAQIARHLEISEHTTQDYIKAVFRHFRVHSRAELLARFHRGDGGD